MILIRCVFLKNHSSHWIENQLQEKQKCQLDYYEEAIRVIQVGFKFYLFIFYIYCHMVAKQIFEIYSGGRMRKFLYIRYEIKEEMWITRYMHNEIHTILDAY